MCVLGGWGGGCSYKASFPCKLHDMAHIGNMHFFNRRTHPVLRRDTFVGVGGIAWHGKAPGEPDWSEESRLVAYTLSSPPGSEGGLYIAFNTSHRAQVLQPSNV